MKRSTDIDPTIRANFNHAKLLVVEDNPDHGFIIQSELRRSMPEVKTILATNADETRSYLSQCQGNDWDIPKMVLLDLYLPDRQDGWDLLDYIRGLPADISKIPVVLFSYSGHREDIVEAYQRGCSSYLVKPSRTSEWQAYFDQLRSYWWETVTLPSNRISVF
ncbi:response regulator [Fibrella aestuarina]|nr:response regulator [Fibrella aestuarina]